MLEELMDLNERILAHVGVQNSNIVAALPHMAVCIGKLKPSAMELSQCIANPRLLDGENTLDVVTINRDYLAYCRLVARDVINGKLEGLVVLDIDMTQAHVLAAMTTKQIVEIARRWQGTVFRTLNALACNIENFHGKAIMHYPTALLAA